MDSIFNFFCFQNLKPTIWVPSNRPKNQNWTTLVYMSKQTRSLGEKHSARVFQYFSKSWRCGRLTRILLASVSNYTGGLILRRYYECWNRVVTRIGLEEFGSVTRFTQSYDKIKLLWQQVLYCMSNHKKWRSEQCSECDFLRDTLNLEDRYFSSLLQFGIGF